ncbi:Fe2+-dependent dioxygenase [Pseudomonas aeruginosa]|nr:Fe2+-dependent dioxygenase [Pseudomonas aeruginosa]
MQINIIGNHFAFMDSAMLLHIPAIFTAEEVSRIRAALEQAEWADGKATAGYQSAKASTTCNCRRTTRWPGRSAKPCCSACGTIPCLCPPPCRSRSSRRCSTATPAGGSFDFHIDNAVRDVHGGRERVRTDLSSTLFFSDPEDYDGGELVIQDTYGLQQVKLPAGDLVLYPGTSLHKVNPVTRGARYASFFWTQSLVREDSQRTLLFEMDQSIQRLTHDVPDHPSLIRLTGTYHNLLRRWSEPEHAPPAAPSRRTGRRRFRRTTGRYPGRGCPGHPRRCARA